MTNPKESTDPFKAVPKHPTDHGIAFAPFMAEGGRS